MQRLDKKWGTRNLKARVWESESFPKEPMEEQLPECQEVSSWSDSVGQEQSPGGGTVLPWPAKWGQLCLLTSFPKEVRQMRLGWLSVCQYCLCLLAKFSLLWQRSRGYKPIHMFHKK